MITVELSRETSSRILMDDRRRRLLAACDQCGSVYAAIRNADRDIIPVGSRTGCSCGGSSFSEVEGSQ